MGHFLIEHSGKNTKTVIAHSDWQFRRKNSIRKIQSDSTLTEKNIYFRFWLQFYYGAWDL